MKTKKFLIIFVLIVLVIVGSIICLGFTSKNNKKDLKNYNHEYEQYLDKTITGVDLATLVDKAINQNEENKIKKDTYMHYIEDEKNSIKIEIKIKKTRKTYPMEEFYNNDMDRFIEFFGNEKFKCTGIEYHDKSGKLSKMFFKQIA